MSAVSGGIFLALSDEQAFLREAAGDALARVNTLEGARSALDGEAYPDLWPVAVEAGWTGVLSGEDAGGSELGAYEAMLILEACGERLADARLLGHLPAVALLESARADATLRAELASGEKRAALVHAAPLDHATPLDDATPLRALDVAGADVLVVVTDREAWLVQGTASPVAAYDATRSLADVTLDDATRTPLDADPALALDLQRALLAAESVGAASACLVMARDYAVDRMAFGRAIGSYQAIKHKLVEMLRLVEHARSLLVAAGRAWDLDGGATEFALLANAARVAATEALDFAAPENIFIHGGVGATWEHDASLYYRRAELSRRLAGGQDAAADRVASLLLQN